MRYLDYCIKSLEVYWGVAKLVKALGFDPSIRRFESFLLSQYLVCRRSLHTQKESV